MSNCIRFLIDSLTSASKLCIYLMVQLLPSLKRFKNISEFFPSWLKEIGLIVMHYRLYSKWPTVTWQTISTREYKKIRKLNHRFNLVSFLSCLKLNCIRWRPFRLCFYFSTFRWKRLLDCTTVVKQKEHQNLLSKMHAVWKISFWSYVAILMENLALDYSGRVSGELDFQNSSWGIY